MSNRLTYSTVALALLASMVVGCKSEDAMSTKREPKPFDLDKALASGHGNGGKTGMTWEVRAATAADINASNQNKAVRNWRASIARGRPSYAVLDHDLPDGAVAQVIRDAAAAQPRLIVVSAASVDDQVIGLAEAVLRRSEMNNLDLPHARTITLWRDGRVLVSENGQARESRFPYQDQRPVGTRVEADILLRSVASVSPVRVPNVGVARVLATDAPRL